MYALRACDEGVLFFPVYAVLFAGTGLSPARISSLFVIWSVVTMTLEVPSGAWADVYSRRRLLALAALLRAVGFALWTLFPSYWAFAAGFVLWGARSALSSGTRDALLYDELAAHGATDRYPAITGRAATVAVAANLCVTALAAPALAIGGFHLVGAGSVAVALGSAAVAWSFPPRPTVSTGGGGFAHYLAMLRGGLAEVRRHTRVRHATLIAAAVPALAAFDEYLPLLARTMVDRAAAVPLLVVLQLVGMTLGALAAARWAGLSGARLGALLALGAALLATGALATTPVGFVGVAACFGALQLAIVLSNARLQDVIAGPARATVLSIAGAGAEIGAVAVYAVYAVYALGSLRLATPTMVACFAGPLWIVAALTARWLPPGHPHSSTSTTAFSGRVSWEEIH